LTIELSAIPLDDPKTYEMIARGDTGGVFTFETQGYRGALQQMRPDRFEDLIAIQALNRPGPMANIPGLLRAQAWRAMDRAAPGDSRYSGRDLRRDRVSGTGDADRAGHGGL
jgi:DNA polymerase-3 subunit alpha